MPVHSFTRTRILRTTLAQAWDFFSRPENLPQITPPRLDFQILSEVPPRMYPGLFIRYRVKPLAGIPMTWVTEITQVREREYFVDEQRVGPYRLWHHEHHFRELPDGRVEMRDMVTYQLPFGWLSEPAHLLFVKRELNAIFDYREQAMDRIFPD